ncbi:MAG: hypothetical protein ACKN86_13465 [Crocinitomicaceae bacterium]
MLQNFSKLIQDFSPTSRIWYYLADRTFDGTESDYIQSKIDEFVTVHWKSHGAKLNAIGILLHNQLIALSVDDNSLGASGCSIDSSVKLIKELGTELKVDFFNRMYVLIFNGEETQRVHISDLSNHKDWNLLNPIVTSVQDVQEKGIITVSESELVS